MVEEANRLPFGLAAYAFTRSAKTANAIASRGRDRHDDDQPPRPGAAGGAVRRREGFSGYGSEGGTEAIEAYLNTKFVTQAGL